MGRFSKILARRTRALREAAARAIGWKPARGRGPQPYFYLGPNLALTRLESGHALYVDPQDDEISARIILRGYWEYWTTQAVLSLLKPGDRVIEVGANLGYYTVLMADRVGPTGRVTALEANPRLAALTARSLKINDLKHARVLNRAALDQPGEISFVTSRKNSGSGHVEVLLVAPFEDASVIRVEAIRLDDLGDDRVDFIRLDAEGCEPQILRGAFDILVRNPDIVVFTEWSVIQMESRTSVPTFIAWMQDMGFRFWVVDKDARLIPVATKDLAGLAHTDIVASRRPLEQRRH